MNFSNEWEQAYASGRAGSVWPWSDLVSYVMRYAKPAKSPYRVLELGSAVGANVGFFQALGVEYYGIEGSESAVNELHKRFPVLAERIVVGDFTQAIPFDVPFDLIVDRASLTHNSTSAIQSCIALIEKSLIPGGLFIGIDWFSNTHSDFALGTFADDANTKSDIQTGQFKGIGKTHFSDKDHLLSLFQAFNLVSLEHKIVTKEIPHDDQVFASWNFVARKNS
jgi:SAM-dependent methyltransferase